WPGQLRGLCGARSSEALVPAVHGHGSVGVVAEVSCCPQEVPHERSPMRGGKSPDIASLIRASSGLFRVQLGFRLFKLVEGGSGNLRIVQIEPLQGLYERRRNDQSRKPLVVCGNDIP